MKYLPFNFVFFLLFSMASAFGQQGTLTIYQDEKINELVALKTQLSKENKLTDGFTIQLFYGEYSKATAMIQSYKSTSSTWPATIEYETPNYKVWVGNFINRLEADRALLQIQKNFPNAFVLKPDRRP